MTPHVCPAAPCARMQAMVTREATAAKHRVAASFQPSAAALQESIKHVWPQVRVGGRGVAVVVLSHWVRVMKCVCGCAVTLGVRDGVLHWVVCEALAVRVWGVNT